MGVKRAWPPTAHCDCPLPHRTGLPIARLLVHVPPALRTLSALGPSLKPQAAVHGHLQVGFSQRSQRARLHPPVLGLRRPRCPRRQGRGGGLRRLRLHRPVAAHRASLHHDDALLAAGDRRRQADRADGRRHHSCRRPLGQGRDAQDSAHRADRGQQAGHRARLRQVPEVRQRQGRRGDGRQRRVADQAQLHRDAARRRPAFLGQSHADHGLGEAQAGPRPGAVVHRVQLHDPAGLRLRRAGAALRLQPADGRLRPVGQHRHRGGPRPAHGHAPALRPHLPAAHHLHRRQNGQDGGGRGVAQRGPAVGLRLLAVLAQRRRRGRGEAS